MSDLDDDLFNYRTVWAVCVMVAVIVCANAYVSAKAPPDLKQLEQTLQSMDQRLKVLEAGRQPIEKGNQ
jgi:hypothetical protein